MLLGPFPVLFQVISNLWSVNTPICATLFTLMNTKKIRELFFCKRLLYQDIDDCVINIDGFSTFRVDRNVNFRNLQ